MLPSISPCSVDTPGVTQIGIGVFVGRGMPVTMSVVGKLGSEEVNAVGPRRLLVFAERGGTIVLLV